MPASDDTPDAEVTLAGASTPPTDVAPATQAPSPMTSAPPDPVVPTLGLTSTATPTFPSASPRAAGPSAPGIGAPVQRSVSSAGTGRVTTAAPASGPARTVGASVVTTAPAGWSGRSDSARAVPIVWRTAIGEPAPTQSPEVAAVSRLAEPSTTTRPAAGPVPSTGETVGGIRWSSGPPAVSRLTWSDSGGPVIRPGSEPLSPRLGPPVQRETVGPRLGSFPAASPTAGVTFPTAPSNAGWDGSVAFPESLTSTSEEWFGTLEPATVQRQADDTTAPEPAAAPAPASTPTPTTMTATASTGPAATPGRAAGPPTDAEIDKWTRALYPSLRRRLCQDLLLDRERSGYSTDIRY